MRYFDQKSRGLLIVIGVAIVMFCALITAPWIVVAQTGRPRTTELQITTFDRCDKGIENCWGTFFDPGITLATRDYKNDPERGQVMYINYNVEKSGTYAGFVVKFKKPDFRPNDWKVVTLWLRGDSENGYPQKVKIELKSTEAKWGVRDLIYDKGISDKWQRLSIPLKDFIHRGDWNPQDKLDEFIITFAHDIVGEHKKGAIYLDDVTLER